MVLGYLADNSFLFLFILGLYFFINLFYSFGLKNIAILDILILSAGFVLRVKGGAVISKVDTSEWLIIMTFLLSLFMAIAKRRDDLLLKGTTGTDMRKSMSGYNLDFLNTMLGLSSAIIIVAYINYTVSPRTIERLGTYRLYYSSLFVIAGLMRYLQITFVLKKSGSPTEILYKDFFIQITLALWVVSIYVILYLRDITHFQQMKKQIANWGNYPVIESNEEFFAFTEQLQELLSRDEPFIPRGNGRCYGDASLAKTTISTLKFDKILSFDIATGVFKCQSGLTLDQILEVIVPAGWFLPVTPGTKFITVGGAVASDVHGKNHHIDGSFSNHILEMEIVLASKETISCSPVSNADLFEATCGGMGLTGIISSVKFQLKKIETSFIRQKQIKADNLEELIKFI